jgi:hypothetical protein
LTLAVLLWGLAPAAWATGPLGPEIRFFSRSGQDPQDDLAYFRGRLGILRPTFTDNRLYAAYRIMLGGSFSDAQARQLLARCCDAPDIPADAATSWDDLRKRVLGATPAPQNTPFRARQRPEDMRLFDVACFPDAYRNAAATLRARIAEHGANSPLVREWVTGQDAVLLNCDMDAALPGELPNAPAWLKADRAYQIAAATFYRLDYARAGELFAEIGRDASSPWQKTARYLVARCAVHAAIADKTPTLIADARQAIDAIASDLELGSYRAEAPKLASLLAFATRPRERAQELEQALLARDLPGALAVELRDFLLLERSGARYTDLGAWIYDIDVLTTGREETVAAAKADALGRWRERRNLPWLVAALMHLSPGDDDAAAAIAASRAIAAGSPAYYTLAWHRLRLLIGENKQAEARVELDQILDGRQLPEGVENLMRYHAMKLARDLDEFQRFALRRGEFMMYLPDPRTRLDATALPLKPAGLSGDFARTLQWRTELFQPNPRYFDDDATAVGSFFMPLPMLARLAQSDRLPSNMQRDLALAVFTRAMLLDEIDIANSIAPIVARYFPQYGAGWKAYQGAATPQQKKLEAALLLLRLPAASPWLASGLGYPYQRDRIGLYGPRWWSHEDADDQQPPSGQDDAQDNAALCDDCALPLQVAAPAFITPQERERARDDGARLRRLPGAPAYLGAIILAWANAQPRDPRVPEALYLVVRATRYGEKNSETSKAAYSLLHDRYRRNPWTSKTPLWFSSPDGD